TGSWLNGAAKPHLTQDGEHVLVQHEVLGEHRWYTDGNPSLLFTENETKTNRLYDVPNAGYVKDAFHERLVNANAAAVNPAHEGTKAAALYPLGTTPGGAT